MTVFYNGEYLAKSAVAISPDDRGFLFGDGVYDATSSYDGRFLALERHIARLERGLRELSIDGVELEQLFAVHHELIRRNQLETTWGLVYIQITRGAAPRTHAFPVPAVRPTIYAYAAPVVPKYDAEKGVSVITVADMRWGRCDLKTVNLLPNCWANQRAREAGAFEAIFVRDGIALEGSHTGLFAVLDETVCTCPNSNYILPSVTRELVLELCRDHGIAVAETPIRIEDLRRASEVFLVGTTSEVLPVIQLDGRPVGPGIPGATTQQLRSLFRELTKTGSTPARAGRA